MLGLQMNDIEFDPRMIIEAPYYCKDSAQIATDKALGSGINPTAIMYPDDYTAIAAIPYLRKLGIHVPRDISITGFDGIDIGEVMRPSITSIKQSTHEIGKKCAELLLKQIDNIEIIEQKHIVPAAIFKGESVAKIN